MLLKKLGLESYALIGLATYFFTLAASYSDFGAATHLLGAYATRTAGRRADLGNAFVLRASLLAVFLAALAVGGVYLPRPDGLYALVAVSLGSALLPSANVEWYLTARAQYGRIFTARGVMAVCQVCLTLAWYFSSWRDPLFVPLILLASSVPSSALLLAFLGKRRIREGLLCLREVSWKGIATLFARLLPMASVLLLTPYFLAYALPWYSHVSADKNMVGTFSISYRLVIGINGLLVPLTLYLMSRWTLEKRPSFSRALGFALPFAMVFWAALRVILQIYFVTANLDSAQLPHAARVLSILMLGVFLVCLRAPYVARRLATAGYKEYFLIHLVGCAPVLALSWLGGRRVPPEAVPWLACLPELLTTTLFIWRERFGSRRRPGAAARPIAP